MADQSVIQVSRLLDERGLSSFQVKLLAWSFFIVLIDGYDIGAIAFAAPSLIKEWGLKPGSLGPVFSASLIGILFGSAIFGWVGDRYGRKAALVLSNLVFGVFTLAAAFSTNLDQMFWLRLMAGLGIGGVMPIVVAAAATRGLPESIKYMTLHENHRGMMGKLIASIRPDYVLPANAKFVIEDEKQYPGFNPVYLFHDGLALITPLLWLLFALNLMGFYFLLSWTPTLMTVAKLPPATAALAGAMLQVGGTVGALALCSWLQKHRFLAVSILFVVAVPVVGSIGFAGLTSQEVLLTATFFAGFVVLGIQSGINVVGAMIYPTSLRANGSGWELGIGRIGSIVGPFLGALLIGLPIETLYALSALPFLVGAVVCFAIHHLNVGRLAARSELRDAQ